MSDHLSKYNESEFSNCIIIKINNNWYDITEYLDQHPGGAQKLENWHLRDATTNFNNLSAHKFAHGVLAAYKITDTNKIKKLELFNIIS